MRHVHSEQARLEDHVELDGGAACVEGIRCGNGEDVITAARADDAVAVAAKRERTAVGQRGDGVIESLGRIGTVQQDLADSGLAGFKRRTWRTGRSTSVGRSWQIEAGWSDRLDCISFTHV